MHDASGLFLFSFMVKAFWGTSDGIAGDGGPPVPSAGDGGRKGAKVLFTFLLFYLFTF